MFLPWMDIEGAYWAKAQRAKVTGPPSVFTYKISLKETRVHLEETQNDYKEIQKDHKETKQLQRNYKET